MKSFVVFVAVAVCAQAMTDEQLRKVKEYQKDCATQTGVDQELLAKTHNGEFTDDPKFKAHLFCFAKKAGFQNDAGDLQVDVIRTKLNAELKNLDATNKLIDKCAVKAATPEDTAFDTLKCYYENTPQHIILS